MPEQVQAAAPDQVLAGKAHDFSYLLPMPGLEAVDLTVFAGRFLFQGTAQPPLECIEQEFTALIADGKLAERHAPEC